MNQTPPVASPEQLDFAKRIGAQMAPLIKSGMDLLDAERTAARLAAAAMRTEGANAAKVAALLADALDRTDSGQRVKYSDIVVSSDLQDKLISAFKAAGGRRLPPLGLLVEKRYTTAAGYPVYLYSNESKHPGCPHVTLILGDERVNVTIAAEPKVLVGNKRARGLKAAMRAVSAEHIALLREWDATRPDDQRLENHKAKQAKS